MMAYFDRLGMNLAHHDRTHGVRVGYHGVGVNGELVEP